MKFYLGHRESLNGGQPVWVVNFKEDGTIISTKELDPEASQKILGISPDGFNWSYGGAGPTLLGFAILFDATDEETAIKYYADFTTDKVATWGDKWQISSQEIKDWLQQQKGGVVVSIGSN